MTDLTDKKLKEIIDTLGEPYYAKDGFVLYNADCIELLTKKSKPLFNLTVTSPPYNIGKSYETHSQLEDYIEWSRKWISAVYESTLQNGTFWLNVGYTPKHPDGKAVPLPYLLWNLSDFYFIQEVVWNYGAGVAGRLFYSPRNEKFLWYVKNQGEYTFNLDAVRDPNVKYPNQKKNGKIKVNALGKNPTDVWQFAKVTSGANRSSVERTAHPAQFPESVIDRVIKASSNVGDIVLDPFMGSGTTAVVAHKNGRYVVGIEISKEYCDLAIKRFENELSKKAQTTLLD